MGGRCIRRSPAALSLRCRSACVRCWLLLAVAKQPASGKRWDDSTAPQGVQAQLAWQPQAAAAHSRQKCNASAVRQALLPSTLPPSPPGFPPPPHHPLPPEPHQVAMLHSGGGKGVSSEQLGRVGMQAATAESGWTAQQGGAPCLVLLLSLCSPPGAPAPPGRAAGGAAARRRGRGTAGGSGGGGSSGFWRRPGGAAALQRRPL